MKLKTVNKYEKKFLPKVQNVCLEGHCWGRSLSLSALINFIHSVDKTLYVM